mmetsp:Transcript_44991/g.111745  ORF Transcript_44991/g.111745 Transcript_44991/m.111745 type:complete len:213 (+) Transcript_44991:388-1026(+)
MRGRGRSRRWPHSTHRVAHSPPSTKMELSGCGRWSGWTSSRVTRGRHPLRRRHRLSRPRPWRPLSRRNRPLHPLKSKGCICVTRVGATRAAHSTAISHTTLPWWRPLPGTTHFGCGTLRRANRLLKRRARRRQRRQLEQRASCPDSAGSFLTWVGLRVGSTSSWAHTAPGDPPHSPSGGCRGAGLRWLAGSTWPTRCPAAASTSVLTAGPSL